MLTLYLPRCNLNSYPHIENLPPPAFQFLTCWEPLHSGRPGSPELHFTPSLNYHTPPLARSVACFISPNNSSRFSFKKKKNKNLLQNKYLSWKLIHSAEPQNEPRQDTPHQAYLCSGYKKKIITLTFCAILMINIIQKQHKRLPQVLYAYCVLFSLLVRWEGSIFVTTQVENCD